MESGALGKTQDIIIGHHTHQFRLIRGWGDLDPEFYPVNDCHEMVIDKSGRIFLLTNECKNNILIYDRSGKLLGSWGHEYPGAHGLTLHGGEEGEALFITDYERHQVFKTDLAGQVLMILDYPVETRMYAGPEQYLPTETAVAPNGDIYVTDGYGLQYVIQYDSRGRYIRHWGGKGTADDAFDCVHGIAVDDRAPGGPTLLITSRNQNALKRFSLDGVYQETIYLPGSFVCRPVIKGDHIYAAVFRSGSNTQEASGYITILDKNNRVISTPGGTRPEYENGILKPQRQAPPIFIHPHDVCVDTDENLYVCQWKAGRSYPVKLERI